MQIHDDVQKWAFGAMGNACNSAAGGANFCCRRLTQKDDPPSVHLGHRWGSSSAARCRRCRCASLLAERRECFNHDGIDDNRPKFVDANGGSLHSTAGGRLDRSSPCSPERVRVARVAAATPRGDDRRASCRRSTLLAAAAPRAIQDLRQDGRPHSSLVGVHAPVAKLPRRGGRALPP